MRKRYFTVGPAALYPKIEEMLQSFIELGYGSISHRSATFRNIYQHTDAGLKKLLGLPNEFGIFFCGSASEIWERILLNTAQEHTAHFVNGDFSYRFYQYAQKWGLNAQLIQSKDGDGFNAMQIQQIKSEAELITVCMNETSTGVRLSPEIIKEIRAQAPQALIAVDIVSAVPYIDIPWDTVDMAFFSGQKGFGLPTGCGVWLVHPKCLEKAVYKSKQQSIGAHGTLPAFFQHYKNFETPSTPNVQAIYLLGEVAVDLMAVHNKNGRERQQLQADKFYSAIANQYHSFVKNPAERSITTMVVETGLATDKLHQKLLAENIVVSEGYGKYKGSHLRIGNYPANLMMPDVYEKLLQVFM